MFHSTKGADDCGRMRGRVRRESEQRIRNRCCKGCPTKGIICSRIERIARQDSLGGSRDREESCKVEIPSCFPWDPSRAWHGKRSTVGSPGLTHAGCAAPGDRILKGVVDSGDAEVALAYFMVPSLGMTFLSPQASHYGIKQIPR